MSSSYSMEPHLWLLSQWVESKLLVSITFWLQPLLGKFSVKLILCHYLTEWPWRRIVTQVKKTCSLLQEVIILKVHDSTVFFNDRSRATKTPSLNGSQPRTARHVIRKIFHPLWDSPLIHLRSSNPKIEVSTELMTIESLSGFLILKLFVFYKLMHLWCSIQNITD